jgi:pilus assembly protein Flp/PilA
MKRLMPALKRFVCDETAPTMMEYGLLVILIGIVAIAGVTLLGTSVNTLFTKGASGFP